MTAQLSYSAEQREWQFGALQDDAVQFVCEILFEADSSVFSELERSAQDVVLGNLGNYLAALCPSGHRPRGMPDARAWFDELLTANGASRAQAAAFNAALAAFLAGHPNHDAQTIAAELSRSRGVANRPAIGTTVYSEPEAWPQTAAFRRALFDGDLIRAEAMLSEALARGNTLLDFGMHVVQPAMYGLGESSLSNALDVAHVHLAVQTAQSVLSAGSLGMSVPPPVGRRVVLACVAGNRHALGLHLVAEAFCREGWRVDDLGPDVPSEAIVSFVGQRCPDVLGVSLALPSHLQVLRTLADQLRATFGRRRPILLAGGWAVHSMTALTDISGVDLIGFDPRQAVAGVSRLCQKMA